MRTFIAVNLTDDIRQALSRTQEALKEKGADVSWVKPENLHITLKFLGEVEETRLQELRETIASSLRGTTPFRLTLEGLGVFPNLRAPRVVWAGAKEGAAELAALQARIEEGLCRIGFPREERLFIPHLTLGRVRSLRGREALVEGISKATSAAFGEMVLESVELMKSQLHPSGSTYTVLESFSLKGAESRAWRVEEQGKGAQRD